MSTSLTEFQAKMREKYTFAEMVKRSKERQRRQTEKDESPIVRFVEKVYEEFERLSWNYKSEFHLPSDFDKQKHSIDVELSPDELTEKYFQEVGEPLISVRFFIEYKDGSFNLWVNYETGHDQDYQYISSRWEKIFEAIIAHSKIGCDRVRFKMSILTEDVSPEIGQHCIEFSEAEVPFNLYEVMLRNYLRLAYSTEEERQADMKRQLSRIHLTYPTKKERIVVRL